VDTREVSDEQLAAIGGERRDLAEVLREVAEGRSVLVYMG
jgi:hypothetical protein